MNIFCEICEKQVGDEVHFCLSNTVQRIVWQAPYAMPEVDFQDDVEIASYCSRAHAEAGLNAYLASRDTKVLWSDVRPIEQCAKCGQDFDTTQWHRTIMLSEEITHNGCIDSIDGSYPARLCNECAHVTEPCLEG